MNETNIETEILKRTEALNTDIYALSCKLERYKDKLSERLYKYMSERLEVLYKEEFDRLSAPYFLEREREKFQTRERRDTLAPRRYRPWYFLWLKIRENRAAKLIVKEIERETEKFFAAREKRLNELLQAPAFTISPDTPMVIDELKYCTQKPSAIDKHLREIVQRSQSRESKSGANDQSQQAAPPDTQKSKEKTT